MLVVLQEQQLMHKQQVADLCLPREQLQRIRYDWLASRLQYWQAHLQNSGGNGISALMHFKGCNDQIGESMHIKAYHALLPLSYIFSCYLS